MIEVKETKLDKIFATVFTFMFNSVLAFGMVAIPINYIIHDIDIDIARKMIFSFSIWLVFFLLFTIGWRLAELKEEINQLKKEK